ncbi:hypothetical protein RJ55_06807 [Drechmeria coniospora]|nr:hypothetical protein RJ55_06807 [Drechmeria coniospora]
MNKRNLNFVDMLDLEAQEEGPSDSDWRSGDGDSTEVDSDGNLRDFVCKDEDAEETLLIPVSRTSTSSDSSYRDELACFDDYGARGFISGGRPRRPSASDRAAYCGMALHDASSCCSCYCCGAQVHACRSFHPYVFASYLKSAIPVVDDFVRSLKSFRNEMDLCDGTVQDRAVDTNTAGSARCRGTGAQCQGSPGEPCSLGVDNAREKKGADDTDSDRPLLTSKHRLRPGRSLTRGGTTV